MPIDRGDCQTPSVNFLTKLVGILPDAFAGKSIPTAALPVDFDLPPNVLIENQQTFVFRLGKIHRSRPDTMTDIFNYFTAPV
jgi:hypothetical protein